MTKTKDPLVTVITVVRNSISEIEATVQSVLRHKSPRVEYIIVDGVSTDGSLEVIRKYADQVDLIISEPDKGIFDAMNKGMLKSSGKYILNIGAGDLLLEDPCSFLTEDVLGQDPDLVIFDVKLSNNEVFKGEVSFITKIKNTVHHQGTLYRRSKEWVYDLQYPFFADFDLNQRMLKADNTKYVKIDAFISLHGMDGASHSGKGFQENYDIVRVNYGSLYVLLAFLYFKWLGMKARLNRKAHG